MSGSGHVQDMNNRLRQNRAQRPSNRPKFKENNREAIYSHSDHKYQTPKFKIVSEEKLAILKKRIRVRSEKEQKKEEVVFAVFLVIMLSAAIAFFWMI